MVKSASASPAQAARVQQLASVFAAFRQSRRTGQRVPAGLRAQVLRALAEGVPEGTLREACSLSWAQLRRWRKLPMGDQLTPANGARVLSVVDSAEPAPPSVMGEVLELRVGPWLVSVRRQPG